MAGVTTESDCPLHKIYFDNAATTFPKPECVPEAVLHYMLHQGSNINRGCYSSAYAAEEMVYETRELLRGFFQGPDSRNVIFAKNVTESLNVLLKGFLRPGDHVLVSSLEHNAVMRPLRQLEEWGCGFTRVPCDREGGLLLEALESCLTPKTRLVVMTHASNVSGEVLPLAEVGAFCQAHGLRFFVDCAQTAGVLPVSMTQLQADALAFTGHKGLMGPQGIGGFLLTEELSRQLTPLLSGGTGSLSHEERMPDFLPDRLEAGTLNLPGIAGLRAGLLWLEQKGLSSIQEWELELTRQLLEGLKPLEQKGLVRVLGRKTLTENRVGIVSFQTLSRDMAEVAYRLDTEYGVQTRVGLHCAPAAHRALGSYPEGAIRFSFGWENTPEQVEFSLEALRNILL